MHVERSSSPTSSTTTSCEDGPVRCKPSSSWFAGEAEAPEDLPARVRDFPSAVGGELLVREATLAVVNTLAPAPKRDEARALLEREYEEWRERDEPRSSRALWGLAWVEFWAGRWALGAEYAARARDISVQYGLEMPQDHLPSAVIAVHRGQLDLAREHSERGLELAHEQFGGDPVQLMAVLGLVARWSGDPSAAKNWFEKADRRALGARVGRAECPLVDSRLRRAASRARSDRRRRSNRRCLGGGCGAGGPRVGVGERDPMPWSRRRRGGGRRSRRFPPRARSCAARGGRRPVRHGAGTARARHRPAGGHGRSGSPARRSRLRSTDSNSSGQRLGSRRLAASSDESAGAGARRG